MRVVFELIIILMRIRIDQNCLQLQSTIYFTCLLLQCKLNYISVEEIKILAYVLNKVLKMRHIYCIFIPCSKNIVKWVQELRMRLLTENHQSIYFDTLTYEVFNYYYELFYSNKTKIVPLNIQVINSHRSCTLSYVWWYTRSFRFCFTH